MRKNQITKIIKSFSELSYVLEDIAEDENTDPRILEKLYKDCRWHFHAELALNPNTPANVLKDMLEFTNSENRIHILVNRSLPLRVFLKHIKNEPELYVLELALSSVSIRLLENAEGTPKELLKLHSFVSEISGFDKETKKEILSRFRNNPKFPK